MLIWTLNFLRGRKVTVLFCYSEVPSSIPDPGIVFVYLTLIYLVMAAVCGYVCVNGILQGFRSARLWVFVFKIYKNNKTENAINCNLDTSLYSYYFNS